MNANTRLAPAKINLTLHVTGQRDDGYHLLDSLVVFAQFGDVVGFAPSDALTLEITGPQGAGLAADEDNLIMRAARLCGLGTGHFTLDKRLPVASGMGGGSSDAAAALHLIHAQSGADLPNTTAAMGLGADLPVCLAAPHPQRMRGLGERVDPVASVPALWILLVNPGQGLSTPKVFKALQKKNNPAMPAQLPRWSSAQSLCAWLADHRNDLQTPASTQIPAIDEALQGIKAQPCCLLARMTGSGATCFGIFADEPSLNAAAAAMMRPGWFIQPTRTIPSVS